MIQWDLEFTRSAHKAYEAMPQPDRQRLGDVFDRMTRNPSGVDLKKLQGGDDYRIRYGRWRAIIAFDQARHVITVLQIDQRKDAYR